MKMIFANLEEVPEHLRKDAIKQEDGSYVLEGDGANGILTKNKELLELNKQYKQAADKWKELKDVDPAKAKLALEEMARLEEERSKLQSVTQQAVAAAAQEWQKKLDIANGERDSFKSALEARIIDADLATAISEAKGNPIFIAHHLRPNVKTFNENGQYVVKVIDPKTNQPRINAKGEPMTMAELVAEAKADKKFASAFIADAGQGGGSKGNPTPGNQGGGTVVRLSSADAKNPQLYRQALEQVKGDASKIQYTD